MNSTTNPPGPFPGHDGGQWAPVASEVVASWPEGHFAENLAVDPTGSVYVSLHSHNRIDRFDPKTGRVEEFARLAAPAAGLAFDSHGSLLGPGGALGEAPGFIVPIRPRPPCPWVWIPAPLFMNPPPPH